MAYHPFNIDSAGASDNIRVVAILWGAEGTRVLDTQAQVSPAPNGSVFYTLLPAGRTEYELLDGSNGAGVTMAILDLVALPGVTLSTAVDWAEFYFDALDIQVDIAAFDQKLYSAPVVHTVEGA